MGIMKASVLRMGRTLSYPDRREIFIQSIWVELYIIAYLFLFLSDMTPFPPRALSVYASIPLAFLGLWYFQKATPTLRYLFATLAVSWAYQQVMRGEVGFKVILATFASFFIAIYFQQMGEEGLERLKNYLALFFILSFVLFIWTMLSDAVLGLREGLYMALPVGDFSVSPKIFRGEGGLASTRFFLGYQIAAGICLFIGEVYKRGLRKSILQLGLIAFSALTLILAGERSALAGVALALLVIGFIVGKPGKIIFMSLILVAFYFPLKEVVNRIPNPTNETTISKLTQSSHQEGAWERIEVQLWALSQIPFYPMGIQESGVKYDTLVMTGNFANPIAPHNGYITRVLAYGWFLLFIVFAVFYKIVKMVIIIKHKKLFGILPVLGGLIGALANALFHNPSFLSYMPETIMLLMLFGAYFDYSLGKRLQNPFRSYSFLKSGQIKSRHA